MVPSGLMKFFHGRRRSLTGGDKSRGNDDGGKADGLLWSEDIGRHLNGEFSLAVVQANFTLEDQSQLEFGPLSNLDSGICGTFVGIYDGHGGPEASRFITDHLFNHLKSFVSEQNCMSDDVINRAFSATEEGFLSLVRKEWLGKPGLASVGSCCLIGVISEGSLYVANAGDSRAVLGRLDESNREVKAVQLSAEHNASIESVRRELHTLHPDDSEIVVLKQNVWRVKGLIQVSRSIGDAYLKNAEFNREPLIPRFRLAETFDKPILKFEPTVSVQKLQPDDQFLIFASDGLWEHISSQEAVNIVYKYPRNGIARRLVEAAICEATKKRGLTYLDVKRMEPGVRRNFHDDIAVTVLFLDPHPVGESSRLVPKLSIKNVQPSVSRLQSF